MEERKKKQDDLCYGILLGRQKKVEEIDREKKLDSERGVEENLEKYRLFLLL